MSAEIVTPEKEPVQPERYKNLIVVLTVLTTVFAAVLAALQADASIRADIANRESQYFAVLASGELSRAGLASNYEFSIFSDYLKNLQQATILELTALEQETDGNESAAEASRTLAAAAQASAEVGEKFSVFYTDPRYAPQSADELPKAEQYLNDVFMQANELVARQNAAADEYDNWNRKADSYVTALTVLAVAFFLFGLAQALKTSRLRLIFAVFGSLVTSFSMVITTLTLLP